MALYTIVKPLGQKMLKPLVNIFFKTNPNVLTLFGLLFSGLAGACFLLAKNGLWLLLAIPCILLRMAFNVIDGMVARETGKTSAYGEALAEFADRISDACILIGIAFSGYCHVTLGLLGLIAVLLVSYVGILAKAVGTNRNFGGMLGKVDRLILIIVFCLAQYLFPNPWLPALAGSKNFDLLMVVFIAGSVGTIVQRWRILSKQLIVERRNDG